MIENKREKAINLMGEHQFNKAIPIFIELIQIDSNDIDLFTMLGNCYEIIGSYDKAEEALLIAKNLINKSTLQRQIVAIYFSLGLCNQKTEKFSNAINYFEGILEIQPNHFNTRNSLGLTNKKMGNFDEALENYFECHRILNYKAIFNVFGKMPSLEEASGFKIFLKIGKEADQGVHEDIKTELRSNIMFSIILNNIATIYFEWDILDTAQEIFETSIKYIPKGSDYIDPIKQLSNLKKIK